MRKLRRILLVLIASGLIVSLTMIIPAGAASSQKGDVKVMDAELVYAETDSVGTIEKVQVVDWVSLSGDGTVNVREDKGFSGGSKFQGVHGFATPKVEGDQIVWGDLTSKGDAQAIASTQFSKEMVDQAKAKIPLDLHYTYTLDGKKVNPEDITGQSGHFKMELTMTNKSKEKSTVEYKDPDTGQMKQTEVETYLPMVIAPYDWYFDNKVFHNLTADETGVVFFFPDFYQVGWSIPLFPPATKESDTISIEADVTDFRMPVLTLPVAFVFPKTNQIDPLPTFKAGFEQLYGGIKQVDQGIGDTTTTNTLLNGITQVDSGLQQMASTSVGLPYAKANIDSQLIPGVDSLITSGVGSAGTPGTLLYGVNESTAGLNAFSAGIGSATGNGTLLWGMDQLKTGLDTTKSALGSLITGVAGIIGGLNNPSGVPHPGVLQLAQSIQAGTAPAGAIYTYLTNIITYCDGLIATYPADPRPPGIKAIAQGLQASISTSASSIYAASTGIISLIGSSTTNPSLLYGAAAVEGGLIALQAGVGSATTPSTALYAVDQVTKGLETMKAGIGSSTASDTLLYAMAQMKYGLAQVKGYLSSGSQSAPGIKEGLELISAGLQDAVTGLGSAGTQNSLLYGTSQISSGLTQMKGGTSQMSQGLLDSLVTLNSTDAQLEAIAQRGKDFDHFLGRAENADNQVRFLFQSKPTYDYKTGGSVITAIILSLIILVLLIGGGLFLVRRAHSA